MTTTQVERQQAMAELVKAVEFEMVLSGHADKIHQR